MQVFYSRTFYFKTLMNLETIYLKLQIKDAHIFLRHPKLLNVMRRSNMFVKSFKRGFLLQKPVVLYLLKTAQNGGAVIVPDTTHNVPEFAVLWIALCYCGFILSCCAIYDA